MTIPSECNNIVNSNNTAKSYEAVQDVLYRKKAFVSFTKSYHLTKVTASLI